MKFSVACAGLVSAAATSPNILLIFSDQWRADWAGFDAPDVRAPNIAAIARNGTRFTHAYVPSPLCAPSRGSLASGRDYDENPISSNMQDYDLSYETIFQRMQAAGYHTMVTGKDHLTMSSGVSLDGSYRASSLGFSDQGRSLDKFEDFTQSSAQEPYGASLTGVSVTWQGQQYDAFQAQKECYGQHGGGDCCTDQNAPKSYQGSEIGYICPTADIGDDFYVDNWTEEQAEALLDRKPADKPWFLWVSFPGPHPPFILTDTMMASVKDRSYPLAVDNNLHSESYQLQFRRSYAAEIENIDRLIGKLMAKLQLMGEASNTLVILASDHGDELGDHGNLGKMLPWQGATHVPLILAGPGVGVGKVVSMPVATLDIAGTMLEAARSVPGDGMTTQSLFPLLGQSDGGAVRDFVRTGFQQQRGPGGAMNWRAVIRRFNDTAVLKFLCCVGGCPSGSTGSMKMSGTSTQIGLFNITEPGSENVWGNILGQGRDEAQHLVKLLPSSFASTCATGLSAEGLPVGDEVSIV